MHANPYIITYGPENKFPWGELYDLQPELTERILALSASTVFARRMHNCDRILSTVELKPDTFNLLKAIKNNVQMLQTLKIERSRATIEGHGREDKLTVTLSDEVVRTMGLLSYVRNGWLEDDDINTFSKGMFQTQTWTDVKRFRLRRGQAPHTNRWFVELLPDGISQKDICFENQGDNIESFALKLTDKLHLRHVYNEAKMCDEYVM